MNKITTLFVILCLSGFSGAQVTDDLKGAPRSLDKTEQRFNAVAPKSSALANKRVVVRVLPTDCLVREDGMADIEGAFLSIGAQPTLDIDGIDRESAERQAERANGEVDQSTVPGEGKLQVAAYNVEFAVQMTNKREALSAFWGSFFRGVNFDLAGNSWTTMITLRVREKATGTVIEVLKVAGTARNTDRLGTDIVGGLLSNRLGVNYQSEDDAGRQQRSWNNAIHKLTDLLKWKFGTTQTGKGLRQ